VCAGPRLLISLSATLHEGLGPRCRRVTRRELVGRAHSDRRESPWMEYVNPRPPVEGRTRPAPWMEDVRGVGGTPPRLGTIIAADLGEPPA